MRSKNKSPRQFRKREKSLHLLPHEIIEEILSKLPVKSVLRFRCVSKSWLSSINSRFFIKKSLRNSTIRRAISPNDDPNNYHLMKDSIVVGSCNGLFCILKEKCFFLWNPTIKIFTELPKLELSVTKKYGFGWDEGNDAYKVFVVVSNQGQDIGKVYSTKTNSWKTVDHGCLSLFRQAGNFSRGKIHWHMNTGGDIEYFDLKSEVFGMIEKPCEPGVKMWVQDRYGSLIVVCSFNETRLDLWVMKKYGVKESWVKQSITPIPPEYGSNYVVFFNQHDDGMTVTPWKPIDHYYIESLVSPVWNSRQEQIHEMVVDEGRPKRQIKRRPARVSKRKAAGYTKEAEEIEQEKACESIVEGRPKRQNKKRAVRCGVEGTKENQEMEQEQVDKSVADDRPKRQNRRRPARYGYEGAKESPEIGKDEVQAAFVNEGRPKRQNKRKKMEQEPADSSVSEGRPKRENRRRPARYDT